MLQQLIRKQQSLPSRAWRSLVSSSLSSLPHSLQQRLMVLLTTVIFLLVLCVVLSVPSLFIGPSDAEAVNVATPSDWHGSLGWQDDGGIATNVVICQWLPSGFVRKHGVAETDGRADQEERDIDRGDDFLHVTENSTVKRYPWVAQFRQPVNNYYFHNRSDPSFAPRRRLRYTAYIRVS
jgi:hypothetical protein